MFGSLSADITSYIFMRLLLSAFGLVAGFTILWSILPRKNKGEVNGVLIDLASEKRLAAHIQDIAAALKEPMPSEVYLLGEANAFVSQRGGFMGMGSRRIMGVGLPLMQMLTVPEFRAVLAHEFAHYYAGDTRLGPWVYGTTRAIARVYENLGRKSPIMSFLTRWIAVAAPYMVLMWAMRAYWKLFMRITQMISRRQEFRSDELACCIAGSQPLIDGLQSIHRSQAALSSYWNSVVFPVAVGGFQPRIADGFRRFMEAPQIAKSTSDIVAKEIAEGKTSAFDSHPSLQKRIERARAYNISLPATSGERNGTEPPMIAEIEHLDTLESALLKKFVPALEKVNLKPMTWETAAGDVYVPMWRDDVARYLPWLETQQVRALPALMTNLKALSDQVPTPPGELPNRDRRDAKALEILSRALTLSLIDHGWKLVMSPGTFYLESSGTRHDPFGMVGRLKTGKMSNADWEAFCSEQGVGEWPLGRAPVSSQTVPATA